MNQNPGNKYKDPFDWTEVILWALILTLIAGGLAGLTILFMLPFAH